MTSTDDERSKIPNLMKIGAIPMDTAMDYDTMVLDPVVNNQNFCRFVLDNRGFLNSFSRIQLSVAENSDPVAALEGTLPAGVGIYSLIDRVSLRIGTETVSEIVDFQHWMAYKSMFIDSDINLERETYLTSRIMSRRPMMVTDSPAAQSNVNASGWGVGTNKEYTLGALGVQAELEPQEELRNDNFSEFSVSVADLVPWLRFNQLPLYMFGSTQIALEIHFTPNVTGTPTNRMITNSAVAVNTQFEIDTTKTQFIADYIYYDNDLMARFAAENRNMNWTYTDYRLAKRSFTHTALASSQIVPIGGAGRLVNKVIAGLQPVFVNADYSLLNIYQAASPGISASNTQLFTTNLVYNNNRLYPVDRTSPSVHFHDLVSTEQNIPHISQQEYSRGGVRSSGGIRSGIANGVKYNALVQNAPEGPGLEGTNFWIGYRLNRNERVDSKGIDLQIQYPALANGQYIHRAYLELVKTASLTPNGFTTGLA